jgi:hypothetical protein
MAPGTRGALSSRVEYHGRVDRGRVGLAILCLAVWCFLAGAAGSAGRGVSVDYKAPPGGRGGLEGTVRIYEHSLAVVIGIDRYQSAEPARATPLRRGLSRLDGSVGVRRREALDRRLRQRALRPHGPADPVDSLRRVRFVDT